MFYGQILSSKNVVDLVWRWGCWNTYVMLVFCLRKLQILKLLKWHWLQYFCIAPGSRSSPLAVAAAENYKATCISCIDERSLAFHALGYGRGACKPAVVITSSGTAVSNLLPAVCFLLDKLYFNKLSRMLNWITSTI